MIPCPSDEQLSLFLDESLAGGDAVTIEPHLLGCTACQKKLEALTDSDAVRHWRHLREEDTGPFVPSPVGGELLDRPGKDQIPRTRRTFGADRPQVKKTEIGGRAQRGRSGNRGRNW